MRGGENGRQIGVRAGQANQHLIRPGGFHFLQLLRGGQRFGADLRVLVTIQRIDNIS
ncbi:hypothetical protein D3C81_1416600 [compost metagenome]